jgi:hypothetical protein
MCENDLNENTFYSEKTKEEWANATISKVQKILGNIIQECVDFYWNEKKEIDVPIKIDSQKGEVLIVKLCFEKLNVI